MLDASGEGSLTGVRSSRRCCSGYIALSLRVSVRSRVKAGQSRSLQVLCVSRRDTPKVDRGLAISVAHAPNTIAFLVKDSVPRTVYRLLPSNNRPVRRCTLLHFSCEESESKALIVYLSQRKHRSLKSLLNPEL